MKNSIHKIVSFFIGILLIITLNQHLFCQKINKNEDIDKIYKQYLPVLKSMGKENYDDAIKRLKIIAKRFPNFLRATARMVEAYQLKKDLDGALEYFRRLIEKNPKDFSAHYGLGWVYRYLKQYDKAVEQFKKSIDLKPDRPSPYLGLVGADLRRKKKNKADVLEVELFLKKQIKKTPTNACVYFGLGMQYENKRKLDKALSLMDKALELDPNLWIVYSSKATIYYIKGEYREVIKYLNIELDFALKNKDIERERRIFGNLGVIHRNLGSYKEALEYNNRALGICRNIGNKKNEGRHLTNMSNIYMDLGDYEKALMYLNMALVLNQETGNRWSEAITLGNIGHIYDILGDHQKSILYSKKALAITKQIGHQQQEGRILGNIGTSNKIIGNYEKALEYYERALEINKKTGDKNGEGRTLKNIGTVYHSLENYQKALQYYKEALKINRKIGHKYHEVFVLDLLGGLYKELKNYSRAMKYFKRAIAIAKDMRIPSINWQAFFGLASVYQEWGELDQALAFYKKSIEIIEGTRAKLQIEEYKSGFLKDKIKVYESLVNLLYEMHQKKPSLILIQEAFCMAERAKARAFLDSLQDAKIDLKKILSIEIKEKNYRINRGISRLQTHLLKPNLAEKERNEILNKLENLEDQYQNLRLQIKRENPEYAGIVYPEPYRLKEIQKWLLSEDTAVIEYFLGKEHSFMFCITKNDFEIQKLPLTKQLNESVYAYLKLLSSGEGKRFRGIAASRYLYKKLINPFEYKIKGTKNLIIIPDGYLHYLPFETLISENTKEKTKIRYLVEDYKISYAPSASSLINLLERKRKTKENKDLLAFADPVYAFKKPTTQEINAEGILREFYLEKGFAFYPLKYSGREVKRIAKLIKKPYRDIYIGKRAKEEILKKLPLIDYKIIHFATHGLLDEQVVGRSGLVLTLDDDPTEDGFFQVREIYNSRLNADLVVLSACQTGKGKLEKGEGVSGLSRAFLYAGAESVVVSLWNINDRSTALFMSHFYKYLVCGESKAEALRLAKLKMLDSKFSRPYHWAAFVLIGDFNSSIKIAK